jgi:DNA invertase Pin-like site-specific DNA recombinase
MARNRRASPSPSLRAIGYIRLSPVNSREAGDSAADALGPAAQRKALDRWCASNGAELVSVFEDLDVSGGAALDKRPALMAALDAIEETGATVLLVAKRDRLARDVVNAAMIERLAERAGARIRSAAGEGTDGDAMDPSGMLMRGIVDLFAQYERAVIRARTRSALAVKASRGERTGQIPYGKRLAADGIHVEDDPAEVRVLALVHALRAEGLSLRAIVARLEADGAPCRGGRWHLKTVVRLLDREAAA